MAFLFGCENVCLEYPSKRIFQSISLGVNDGDCIGVVGRNGDGKSSLLGLFDGSVEPDSGRVLRTKSVRFASLRQSDELKDGQTIAQSVVGDVPEYTWASNANIREIITGLIGDLDWDAHIATLSGGERRRVDLARVLITDADVVLLDEPTNHLDVEAIAWLAQHLKRRFSKKAGALVVVTHDRWFLDEVCQSMWEVHDGIVEPFEGGYSAYILQRVERDRLAQQAEQKRQNLMRRELAWLSRGARARSTKPKFHVEAAKALIASEPPLRNSIELKRAAISRLGKQCVSVEDVTFAYKNEEGKRQERGEKGKTGERYETGEGYEAGERYEAGKGHEKPVLSDVTWLIGPGDRFGLLGANGAGKSTLLGIVQGILIPQKGRVKIGKTVKFAFLSQKLEELDKLGPSLVREVLARYKSKYVIDGKEVSPAQLFEQLGFSKSVLSDTVDMLSGGQKRRLQLMLILLDAPNVLILDEPSNDLDTDMLVAMENVLDTWPGTLILVSHDRYLMERVTDHQYALIDGRLRHVPRGVDEYLELLQASRQNGQTASRGGLGSAQTEAVLKRAQPASQTLRDTSLSGGQAHRARKQLASLERKMHTLDGKIEQAKQEQLTVDPTDYAELGAIQQTIQTLKQQKEALEEEWLELSVLLECGDDI